MNELDRSTGVTVGAETSWRTSTDGPAVQSVCAGESPMRIGRRFLHESTADRKGRKQQSACGDPLTAEAFTYAGAAKQATRKTMFQEGPIEVGGKRYKGVRSLKALNVLVSTRAGQGVVRWKFFNSVHIPAIPRIAWRLKRKRGIIWHRPHTAAILGIRDMASGLGGSVERSDNGRISRRPPPTGPEISGNRR